MENCSVSVLISNTCVFCSEKLKKNGVTLEIGELPNQLSVHCRGNQMSQVILNLLNNANDAISHLPEKWIRLEVEQTDNAILIAVSNSGPKIPPEVAEQIFRPFFTTKPVGKGTGLGLSISMRIMGDHKGSLSLDEFSAHTRFVISLPKRSETEAQAA